MGATNHSPAGHRIEEELLRALVKSSVPREGDPARHRDHDLVDRDGDGRVEMIEIETDTTSGISMSNNRGHGIPGVRMRRVRRRARIRAIDLHFHEGQQRDRDDPFLSGGAVGGTDGAWDGYVGHRSATRSSLRSSTFTAAGRQADDGASSDWFRIQVTANHDVQVAHQLEERCSAAAMGEDLRARRLPAPLDSECEVHLRVQVENLAVSRVPERTGGSNDAIETDGGCVPDGNLSCVDPIEHFSGPSDNELFGVILSQDVPVQLLWADRTGSDPGGVLLRWSGQRRTRDILNQLPDDGGSPSRAGRIAACLDFPTITELRNEHTHVNATPSATVPHWSVRSPEVRGTVVHPGSYQLRTFLKRTSAVPDDAGYRCITPGPGIPQLGSTAPFVAAPRRGGDRRVARIGYPVALRERRASEATDPIMLLQTAIESGRPGGAARAAEARAFREGLFDETLSFYRSVGAAVRVFEDPEPGFGLGTAPASIAPDALPPYGILHFEYSPTATCSLGAVPGDLNGWADVAAFAGSRRPAVAYACVRVADILANADPAREVCSGGLNPSGLSVDAARCQFTWQAHLPPPFVPWRDPHAHEVGRTVASTATHELGHLVGLEHTLLQGPHVRRVGGGFELVAQPVFSNNCSLLPERVIGAFMSHPVPGIPLSGLSASCDYDVALDPGGSIAIAPTTVPGSPDILLVHAMASTTLVPRHIGGGTPMTCPPTLVRPTPAPTTRIGIDRIVARAIGAASIQERARLRELTIADSNAVGGRQDRVLCPSGTDAFSRRRVPTARYLRAQYP